MKLLICWITLFICQWGFCTSTTTTTTTIAPNEDLIHPDTMLTVEQLVKKYGYPFEEYADVVTEDGYLLDVYRIPYGKNNTKKRRPAVLLVHGLTGSSRNFVTLGPNRSIAFVLADNGFDVWLSNTRGTTVSRKHLTLTTNDPKYWDFSFHEVGVYDIPAMFELMKNVTKLERFAYIGHSQGTTTYYVLGADRPEYNRNISVAVMFGPQVHVAPDNPFLKLVTFAEPIMRPLAKSLGMGEYPPPPFNTLQTILLNLLCTVEGPLQDICISLFYIEGGYNPDQLIKREFPRIVSGMPSVAAREGFHYAQNVNTGEFRKYDYGTVENLKRYGTETPPLYNLSMITSPMALYYSFGDWLVDPNDVEKLCAEMSNCVYKYLIPDRRFTHFDFLLAKDAVKLVYRDVIKTLKRMNKNCRRNKAC